MMQFIGNLIGVKADKAVQAGMEALVRWDPKSASEAELRSMEQHLDDLGRQVATARQSFDKEQKEADAIDTLSRQRMAAAELLQSQIAAEADPLRKAGLEHSLGTLVTMLEQMAPDVERERRDADDAKDFLEMLEHTYMQAGGKLKEGRAQLERAQRDMSRAQQQRSAAEQQAEAEGLDRILLDAGFEWREAGCSMCLGMNPDKLTPGQRCASTSNRNFEGRQGPGGRTHLLSPAMAAAAAVTGRLADVRALMGRELV